MIQAFNKEDEIITVFEKENRLLCESAWKSQFLSGLMQPIMQFIGNLGYVAISILGGYFAISGRITVGNIQSFITYTRNFTQPISQIAQVSNMLQSMAAAAERVFRRSTRRKRADRRRPCEPRGRPRRTDRDRAGAHRGRRGQRDV